jgi:phage gp46-like protein
MRKHYSWLINPGTGDYEMAGGSPQRDTSLQFPAYARLKVRRGAWMYSPNSEYGSDFGTVRKRSSTTPALLESIGTRALQPLLDDGRATDLTFASTGSSRHSEELECSITDSDSNTVSFSFTPVGG